MMCFGYLICSPVARFRVLVVVTTLFDLTCNAVDVPLAARIWQLSSNWLHVLGNRV